MKRKNGFTLIELLAVIVILAIIALIATPIVLNMINSARKSAAKSSALGYIDAIEYNNGFAEVDQPGYTMITGTKQVSELSGLKFKGKAPESGSVTVDESGKVTTAELCINDYKVEYTRPDVTNVTKGCDGSSETTPAAQPESFAKDDWSVIAANTTSDKYNVGDTKCVALDGLTTTNDNGCNGNFKVRIANKTACTTEESQTACGFVVEFVDVIAEHNMNPSGEYKGTQYNNGWNVDGYPASALYQEYFAENATNSLYAKLPSDLQSAIIDTTVVSSHGSTTGETNFTSNDKLYLLSRQEVFGDNSSYDTAASSTRQLDYYNTNNNNASRIKQYNGSNAQWWLRSARSDGTDNFSLVRTGGSASNYGAINTLGIAPAFRIGS